LIFHPKTGTFVHRTSLQWCNFLPRVAHTLCNAFLLLWFFPTLLVSQTKLIIRPRFDPALISQRSFYPHKVLARPKIALVLSGGGARGAAQIGVLRSLEKHHIPVDFIAATSLGAIVGGLYAAGYTTDELEQIALKTDWDDVLSLTEETRRRDRFIDQKLADDRSFVAVRFQGLEPVIPSAVSTGQRLTNFLSTKTLQALYHPNPSFNDLKVRFRAVTTDLVSGKQVVLKDGSLAEALRASATVPLLFNPVDKDSMKLIDGGLVTNIPVDVPRSEGYDIVIAVNSTSGLRTPDQLNAPWQTADQIMGIMMQLSNEVQLKKADIIITPEVGNHLSSDFTGLDSLIFKGQLATEQQIDTIQRLIERKLAESAEDSNQILINPEIDIQAENLPDSLRQLLMPRTRDSSLSTRAIRRQLRALYAVGDFKDVYAEVDLSSARPRVSYRCIQDPVLKSVHFSGCKLVSEATLQDGFLPLLGKPVNHKAAEDALENMLREYRARGYSLARIKSTTFDEETGELRVVVNEGVIQKIVVEGATRARDSFVLREFPLEEGDVFEIQKANLGIRNINSTKLFEFVYLEVAYTLQQPVLTIRLRERPSQLMRLGLRVDNERNLQASMDLRDENFEGTGTELGFTMAGGGRNADFILEYKAHRLFDTYFTFNVNAFFSFFDSYFYGDAPNTGPNHWDRLRLGEYRDVRYGTRLAFGSQLERFGNATIELSLQNAKIRSLENADSLEERYRLSMVRIGTVIDSKDSYPFPKSGIGMNVSYEFAFQGLGSEVGYNALRFMYESYSTWATRHTFHPKLIIGFADRTMPLGQQFRLGGLETFFGTREDDRRGRQLLLLNLEYRYMLPFRILSDSYLRFRYDMGTISAIPEEIKFSTLRHGVGAEFAIDSPIGPAAFGIGKSFFFARDLPDNPIQEGPFLFYFTLGYQL
jgi:NTE family protein